MQYVKIRIQSKGHTVQVGEKINNLNKNREKVKNDIETIKTQWNVSTVD